MYNLYLIESQKNHTWYIGQTANLKERLYAHNHNKSKFTRDKGPWKLIGCKCFSNRGQAIREERRLKHAKNKTYIKYYFNIS